MAAAEEVQWTGDFETGCQLLALVDLFIGHHEPVARPSAPSDPTAVAEIDLADLTDLHLRFLQKAAPVFEPALAAAGWGIGADASGTCRIVHAESREAVSRAAAHLFLLAVEDAMTVMMDCDTSASMLEAIANTALQSCVARVEASGVMDGLQVGPVHMQPVASWDASVFGGTVGAHAALGDAEQLVVGSTLANDNCITMPNFKDWSADSEFVAHKLKRIEPDEAKSLGRMWRTMFHHCMRAPCHEVIHLIQHYAGQKMISQTAEHDGYFAAHLLLTAVLSEAKVGYPGCAELMLIGDLARINGMIESGDPGFTIDSYIQWRDSFGVDTSAWNGKDFGATGEHRDMGVEFKCGSTLTFEAGCKGGEALDDRDTEHVDSVVKAMLETMFVNRTSTHADAVEGVHGRVLDCTGRPVEVAPAVNLSALSLQERIASISAHVGAEKAAAFVAQQNWV